MALKLKLKPHESVIVGGAVLKNGPKGAEFFVENSVPILREKDIFTERDVTSPCRGIYLTIQLMYIDEGNLVNYNQLYWQQIKDVLAAAPSTLKFVEEMSANILTGDYYPALKIAKKLIDYEEELLKHAKCPSSLPSH